MVAAADEGGAQAYRVFPLEADHTSRLRTEGVNSC
jgi:hypothetical protein